MSSTAVQARRHVTDPGAPLLESAEPAMRASGHSAVMSQRAATAPDDLDYFPTPPWAARAGGELIQRLDPGRWICWEPACGGGHMAHGLSDSFVHVIESDIEPYEGGRAEFLADFLTPRHNWPGADWIVTNPPFKQGEAFVRAAWPRARRGVAMLLRSVFREGARRYRMGREIPLTLDAVFAERVPMVKGRWDPAASSATSYAWFVWMKPEAVEASPFRGAIEAARSLDTHLGLEIPPGSKIRLSRKSDLARFGPDAGGEPLI